MLETDEEVDATEAGRGGILCWTNVRVEVAVGRAEGLGVALPGVVPGDMLANLVFTGLDVRDALVPEVVELVRRGGFPTGVTKPFELFPEIVRRVAVRGESFAGGGSFSAFVRGTNIPDVDVDAVKYRTPATLPSFLPWNPECKSNPTNDPAFPLTAPTNLISTTCK